MSTQYLRLASVTTGYDSTEVTDDFDSAQTFNRLMSLEAIDDEVDLQGALIEENDREITAIHEDVVLLNQMMVDVNTMVGEQQPLVDSIEANIESTAANTAGATKEIITADKYQKKNRTAYAWIAGVAALGITGGTLAATL